MKQEKDYTAAWAQAGLDDDFVFGEVMKRKENGLNLLRAIFPNLEITGVGKMSAQKEIRQSHQGHDVVLDLYIEDDRGRIFDVEMQRRNRKGFWSRLWHYLLYLESKALQKGEKYQDRRPVYLAFLMTYDAMQRNNRIYQSQILFDGLEVPLQASMTLLNSRGQLTKITPELQDVYHLMNGNHQAVTTSYGRKLMVEIERVKMDPEMERKYMKLEMKIEEERADARAEGKNEGKRKREFDVASRLFSQGLTEKEIKENLHEFFTDLTAQEIKEIVEQAQQNAKS